jgi:SAM-dependent methyltransferase
LAPFLLLAEVEIGALLLHGKLVAFDLESARRTGVTGFALQAGVGSLVLGTVLGFGGGVLASRIAGKGGSDPALGARLRTRARYVGAPIADRCYVALKLATDPVVRAIAELGALGQTLDAGSGRGQLGLFLLELGRATSLSGFDFDSRKVGVARAAAGAAAEFDVKDLRHAPLPSADTILLIDVLHYLQPSDQDELLARAAGALRDGGRLLVREVDAAPGARSWLTRVLEAIGTRLGYNRSSSALHFRPLASIVERLETLGMNCRTFPGEISSALANGLVVAESQRSSNSLQNSSSLRDSSAGER